MGMKIAIDSGPLTGGHSVRGIGVMVKEQIKALQLESKRTGEFEINAFDFSKNYERLEKGNFDIVHYTYFFPYTLTLPATKPAKKVIVTIQDLIQLIYPDHYPPGVKGRINFLKQKSRLKYVDAIVTISETSKKDIVRFLGIDPNKIYVIYLAPSKTYKVVSDQKKILEIKKKYKLPERFIYNLGDVNYNKNIPILIEACEIAGIPLVLGGKQAKEIEGSELTNLMDLNGPMDYLRFLFDIPHPEHAHYANLLEKFKNNKNIYRLGYVPEEDAAFVFNLASVYCQPSFYEGFGLSVIHSFACNVPVVISKTNTLVEIAGGAALVADPNDSKQMAEKILQILKNKSIREGLIKRGSERSKFFSWEKNAKETADIYKSVVGKQ